MKETDVLKINYDDECGLVALSPCRTLQNAIQTQKCVPVMSTLNEIDEFSNTLQTCLN